MRLRQHCTKRYGKRYGFGTSQAHHFAMLRTLAQLAPKVSDSEDAPVGEDDWARGLEVLIAADGSTSLFSPSAERSHSR